ncbi:MAG TPA: hypothetical protein VKS01_09675, partial [Bryobacteraceae bacterium]|nr:hypothetical protein [Bryobacteraceae bacterium]
GIGCVPIYNLMEDAATAEICRAQVWQWVKHGAVMKNDRPVTRELVEKITDEVAQPASSPTVQRAAQLFKQMMTASDFPEFLTLAAYENID